MTISTQTAHDEAILDWIATHPNEAFAFRDLHDEHRRKLCKLDVNAFIEYVGREDDHPEVHLVQAPVHERFHELAGKHPRLVIWSHFESGKSVQISVMRVLWLLGNNPLLRIAIVSRTAELAKKIVKSIKAYIENSAELHDVFPELRPGKKWAAQAIDVAGASTTAKDWSVQAIGVGSAIIGARLDVAILDDVLNWENCRTPSQRKNLEEWYRTTIATRISATGQIIVVGNAWHPEDLLHTFAKNPVWTAVKFPVVDPNTGKPRWPERWPQHRIDEWTKENPLEAPRMLHCIARGDNEARFKREWIDLCLKRGNGKSMPYCLNELPSGLVTYTGVDLGTSDKASSDLTVLFTVCLYPNGDIRVLCVESGRWQAPTIVEKIKEHHLRFFSIVVVESNAAQLFIKQWITKDTGIPVIPFWTGKNKMNPEFGVESLAIELSNAKWVIPSRNGAPLSQEVGEWINEMLYYTPDAHTGDRLMACVTPGQLVTTERGLVPIERVVEGDNVLTHKGRFRRVTGVTSREYNGSVNVLRPACSWPLRVTDEHPVWSANAVLDSTDRKNRLKPIDWNWRDAATLRAGRKTKGDFVFAPRSTWGDVDACVLHVSVADSLSLARLIGLYIAEGSLRGDPHQVVFSLHKDEGHLQYFIAQTAQVLFDSNTGLSRKKTKCVESVIYCAQLARAIKAIVPSGSHHKRLPWAWMGLPVRVRVEIVRGWLLGDGSMSRNNSGQNIITGVSTSRDWIEQARQTLIDYGLSPKVDVFEPGGERAVFGTKISKRRMSWRLRLSASDTARLYEHGAALDRVHFEVFDDLIEPRERTNERSIVADDGVAIRLSSNDAEHYEGIVHNLHVEEDESFVVEGVAVHNCWFAREGARVRRVKAKSVTANTLSR